MSLVYPGPSNDLVNVVGSDAFLEATADPGLRVQILDKIPASMTEALRIALNLEALDSSKEGKMRALEGRQEPVEEEPRRREKCAKVAAKPAAESADGSVSAQAILSFADMSQLKEALASCTQQME